MITDSCKLKTKRMSLIYWICWSKFLLKSQRINLHRIRILKAHFARAKLFTKLIIQTDLTMNRTIPFNPETSMRIRSRKKSEFRSHERNHTFDHLPVVIVDDYWLGALRNRNHGCSFILEQISSNPILHASDPSWGIRERQAACAHQQGHHAGTSTRREWFRLCPLHTCTAWHWQKGRYQK